MPDFNKMFDESPYAAAHDLTGDVIVEVVKVVPGELTGEGGIKSKKPLLYLKGKKKPWAACKTDCRRIAKMSGSPNTDDWTGMRVTLYPTTTKLKGETVPCIRCRAERPK